MAFGLVALMASFGVESFLADCLAVGQEVVERVPTGKFEICGSFELVGADAVLTRAAMRAAMSLLLQPTLCRRFRKDCIVSTC